MKYKEKYYQLHRTEMIENSKNHYRDYKQKHRQYTKKCQRKLKKWVVDKLGRKCARCGLISEFDCVYDLHHTKDSKAEKWRTSYLRFRFFVKWRKENNIPKGVFLLCSNCHRIIHMTKIE